MYDAASTTRSRNRGFTLVEVLACLVFLGILMPVVISALLVANRAGVTSERSAVAAQLGENRLSELMLNNEWSSASSRGDFGLEWPGYRWELSKTDWGNGAMTELTLDVAFPVQGIEHKVRLATLVNQAVGQTEQ
jgi:prepilin-type N-terminal cleavage/methylation domain-containing protein